MRIQHPSRKSLAKAVQHCDGDRDRRNEGRIEGLRSFDHGEKRRAVGDRVIQRGHPYFEEVECRGNFSPGVFTI